MQWMRPEDGFLVGIVSTTTEDHFTLVDPKNTEWIVLTEDGSATSSITVSIRVGVRGEIVNEEGHVFRACDIRSLEFSGEKEPPFPHFENKEMGRNESAPRSTKCGDVRPRY